MSEVDYGTFTIPEDTPRTEYSYLARRSDLVQNMLSVNQLLGWVRGDTESIRVHYLATEYGVSRSTIQNDLHMVADYMVELAQDLDGEGDGE